MITKQIAILYAYYSKGATASVPYLKTMSSIVFSLLLLIFNTLNLFGKGDIVILLYSENRIKGYINIAVVTLPLFLIFLLLFKENKLKQIEFSEVEKKKGNKINLLIFIILVLSTPVILFYKYGVGR